MAFVREGWTFAQIPIWAVCDPTISGGALRLLAYLAWRQGSDDACWPSLARIAADLGSCPRTIRRRLRELEDAGYLVTTQRSGRSSRYALVADPDGVSRKRMPGAADGSSQARTAECSPDVTDAGPRTSASALVDDANGAPRTAASSAPDSPDRGPQTVLSPPSDRLDRGGRPGLSPPSDRSDRGPRSKLSPTLVNSVTHDDKQGQNTRDRERRDEKQGDDARLPSWSSVLNDLRLQMTRASFAQWLADSTARREGQTLFVGLADERAVDWVAHRCRRRMLATVRRVFGEADLRLAFEVRQDGGPRRRRGPPW